MDMKVPQSCACILPVVLNTDLTVPDFFPTKLFLLQQLATSNDPFQQVLGRRSYLGHNILEVYK